MKNSRTVAISLIFVGLLAVSTQAQVIPGRWEKAAALSVEMPITVDLKNRDRIQGQFEGLSPSELSLRTHSARAAIPRSEIRRITTRDSDSLANGILIGAGAGIMIPFAANPDADFSAFGVALLVGIAASVGTWVGLGIDAITKEEIVLYQAP